MSPYAQLVQNWKDCRRCSLCETRKQVVMARGTVPAEVLLIGEAPGDSEDILGHPFRGPAGKLLDRIIAEAESQVRAEGQRTPNGIAFFNLVGCIPKSAETFSKRGEPNTEEMEACYPRLDRFINICRPSAIVCVGQLADKQAKAKNWSERVARVIAIVHPAAILRMDVSQKGLAYQRSVVQLSDLFYLLSNGT